ncbi:hypothetical protein H0G86_012445 [Trichoderma simmonsii]|uniref:Uncharacterized protein n=1 Tax=Trichoderma simmonsii TaxID=1491479 RepID=A0A8G0LTR4_9HYPO|nr:hypothetical protein H0G86_012445 [Trichoderma simmonsii]
MLLPSIPLEGQGQEEKREQDRKNQKVGLGGWMLSHCVADLSRTSDRCSRHPTAGTEIKILPTTKKDTAQPPESVQDDASVSLRSLRTGSHISSLADQQIANALGQCDPTPSFRSVSGQGTLRRRSRSSVGILLAVRAVDCLPPPRRYS